MLIKAHQNKQLNKEAPSLKLTVGKQETLILQMVVFLFVQNTLTSRLRAFFLLSIGKPTLCPQNPRKAQLKASGAISYLLLPLVLFLQADIHKTLFLV